MLFSRFQFLPLVAKHFLQDGLWLAAADYAQVLWDPSCQQPPGFQGTLQRGGSMACLHRQESGKRWFVNAETIIVLGWKEGKDVRKEVQSYQPWQLAKRMHHSHLYILKGWKAHERELLMFFRLYTCVLLVLNSWCKSLLFHNVYTERYSHHFKKLLLNPAV